MDINTKRPHFKGLFLLFFMVSFAKANHAQLYLSLSEKLVKTDYKAFQAFQAHQYPALDKGIFKLNLGGQYIKKKYGFFLNGAYSTGSNYNKEEKKLAQLKGYGLNVGAMYYLRKWRDFRIFSRFDLGVHQYKLTYSELLLTNPQYVETFQYQGRGLHEELTTGLEKIIHWQKVDLGFNIAVGYRLGQRQWQEKDALKTVFAHHNGFLISVGILFRLNRTLSDASVTE